MALVSPAPLSVVAFGLGMCVVLLGGVLSWRAYQGYRRNESRPMLLLAVGILLITVVPNLAELVVIPVFITAYLPESTPAVDVMLIVSRGCEVTGVGLLLYSLYVRRV